MGAKYRKLLKLELVIKTDMLRDLERIANASSLEQLQDIRKAFLNGVTFFDLLEQLSHGENSVSKQEIQHIKKDWLDPKTGWWRGWKPEQKLREGLIRAIDIRTEHAVDGRPLPVSYWWCANADAFALVPLLNDQQLTMLLLTPPEPERQPPSKRKLAGAKRKATPSVASKVVATKARKKKKAKR